jgi:hypothetical protein
MGRVIRGKFDRNGAYFQASRTFLFPSNLTSFVAHSPEKGKKHNFQISLIKENRSCSVQNPRFRRERRVRTCCLIDGVYLVTSRESSRKLCTTLVAALLSPRLSSETPTSTSNALSISSPLRASTLVSSSTPVPRVSITYSNN